MCFKSIILAGFLTLSQVIQWLRSNIPVTSMRFSSLKPLHKAFLLILMVGVRLVMLLLKDWWLFKDEYMDKWVFRFSAI